MAEMLINDINREIKESPIKFVAECEDSYHGMVSALATRVCADGGIKVILLSDQAIIRSLVIQQKNAILVGLYFSFF